MGQGQRHGQCRILPATCSMCTGPPLALAYIELVHITHRSLMCPGCLRHGLMAALAAVQIRHVDLVDPTNKEGGWKALPKLPREAGVPWGSVWQGPPHVLFGHHATRRLQVSPCGSGKAADTWAASLEASCPRRMAVANEAVWGACSALGQGPPRLACGYHRPAAGEPVCITYAGLGPLWIKLRCGA